MLYDDGRSLAWKLLTHNKHSILQGAAAQIKEYPGELQDDTAMHGNTTCMTGIQFHHHLGPPM